MTHSDLDFLASCISWIDNADKKGAALSLCSHHYPEQYQELEALIEEKQKINSEFDLAILSPGHSKAEDMYCSACHGFYELAYYSKNVEYSCECGEGVLEPVTEQVIADDKVRIAKGELLELGDNPKAVFLDGFERAFLGLVAQYDGVPLALYSFEKCIEILQEGGMSYEDAEADMEDIILTACSQGNFQGSPVFLEE